MNIRDFATDLARATGFLGRFPIPVRYFAGHDGKMSRLPRTFAFAGLVIALPASLVFYILLASGADSMMSSVIVLAILVLSTGALHEDGLADTADGLGGGRDGDHAISIMTDSRVGTYGAIALIFSFGLRATALAALGKALSPEGAACAVLATAAFSRAIMIWHWTSVPSARPHGLAASVGRPDDDARNFAILSGTLIVLALTWPFFPLALLFIGLGAVAIVVTAFNRLAIRKIGGHTGDTIGATQQLTAITWLCTLALIA